MKTTSTSKKDMYAQVTDEIIAMLESGKTSRLTWTRSGDGLPRNHKTGTASQGVNVLLLWAAAATGGYSGDRWLTYKQATDMGGQVRKGEKSVTCVFFKTLERGSENEADCTEKANSVRMIKPFWLFNLDQIDGIDKPQATAQLNEFQQIDAAESVLRHSGAVIREQGEKAFYRPSTDEIYLPERNRFSSENEFYSVALHELTHWTGAKHRLARDIGSRFGTESYAFEELIAELGSAFLNAGLGFAASTIPNHAGYIESWLKVLKSDKRAIFTAASQASKAHRYIMDLAGGNQCEQRAA
ncbi:Antirestriction protein ArdC [Nitrosospira sp. Nsp11]|uniref:ArdC family protein n=1 Tax=Nitrosospira sp. Nsp11 TaxID=1855338 RepID=UPI000914BFAF|nr:zincin-like metallopeptidase domain-containing protein [Nitrosospira sp. Nsp11]SHL70923.1 Antirestriction protein ArdC [Nitrosospira sp. Nsp11]